MKKTLYDKTFQKNLRQTKSLYGNGEASKKLVRILENLNLEKIPIQKRQFE